MATTYTIYFTDGGNKLPFIIQPYTANGPVSPSDPTIIRSGNSANTTLKLYGKGMQDYGEGISQNMVYMLENFSNSKPPINVIEGQVWYNNSVAIGSPPSSQQLSIYNGMGWDGIILSTGTSVMTGELTLAGNPTLPNHAVPLSFLGTHNTDFDLHLTATQNAYIDGLNLGDQPADGSPLLTATDSKTLIGITGNVQGQFDDIDTILGGIVDLPTALNDKVSKTVGSTMAPNVIINFNNGGGTISGLPTTQPLDLTAATSRSYVDNLIGGIIAADGALDSTTWSALTVGSPPVIPTALDTTLELVVVTPNAPDKIIFAEGIARTTHVHQASEILIDNATTLLPYGFNVQSSLEYIELNKANIVNPIFTGNVDILGTLNGSDAFFTGNITTAAPLNPNHLATKVYVDNAIGGGIQPIAAAPTRNFNVLAADLISGDMYEVREHEVQDNTLSITINGIKQYLSTPGSSSFSNFPIYSPSLNALTGLDPTGTYTFDISVDGGTTYNIIVGSTQAKTTYSDLLTTITTQFGLVIPPLPAAVSIKSGNIEFTSYTQDASSSITISDPVSGVIYLFDIDGGSPPDKPIATATFLSELYVPGSPVPTPDTIELVGNLTATFPQGQLFTINGSNDPNFGTFDGVYSVHSNGASFNGTNTIIPIGDITDPNINIPLLSVYPGGSPAPAPDSYGNIHVTPLLAIEQANAPTAGLTGDYIETDITGAPLNAGSLTSNIVFNYDVLAGSNIEVLTFG